MSRKFRNFCGADGACTFRVRMPTTSPPSAIRLADVLDPNHPKHPKEDLNNLYQWASLLLDRAEETKTLLDVGFSEVGQEGMNRRYFRRAWPAKGNSDNPLCPDDDTKQLYHWHALGGSQLTHQNELGEKGWDYASTKTITNNVHIHLWRMERAVRSAPQGDGPSGEPVAAKRPRGHCGDEGDL